jgi:hypothetical protein
MHSQASAFGWIRSHRRFVSIVVAIALALTIVATLIAAPVAADTDVAAGDDGMVVAGLSWSKMMSPDDPRVPGGGAQINGLSWS